MRADKRATPVRLLGKERPKMKYNLTSEIELTDERAESSYGIPVLVIGGNAYGKADLLPAPFCIAGYEIGRAHV